MEGAVDENAAGSAIAGMWEANVLGALALDLIRQVFIAAGKNRKVMLMIIMTAAATTSGQWASGHKTEERTSNRN